MATTNRIHFRFDNTVSFYKNDGSVFIDANKVYGHAGHTFIIHANANGLFNVSDTNRDITGRITNSNVSSQCTMACCLTKRVECYINGHKKALFAVEMVFEDGTAYTSVEIDFSSRALARKYYKTIKESLHIKKGF